MSEERIRKPHDRLMENKQSKEQKEKIGKMNRASLKKILKWGTEVNYNIIKEIYEKPTAEIILNSEKLKAFPLR